MKKGREILQLLIRKIEIINKGQKMTIKNKFVFGGLCVAMAVLLAGCASLALAMGNQSLGGNTSIGEETSVISPGGTGRWASWLQKSASDDATEKATYQTVQQVEEWPFLCYDYEIDSAELNRGLRAGTYRQGKAYYQPSTGNAGFSSRTVNVESTVTPGYTYYAIHVRKIVNQTVNVVDQGKYQTYYATIIKEKTAVLQQKYNNAVKNPALRDVSDDDVFVYVNGGRVKGKAIKSTLEKQLLTLPSGTVLYNGGIYNSWIIRAEMVNGILKCQVLQ
jgi:hypothetical protein